jgi:hypothetical protein
LTVVFSTVGRGSEVGQMSEIPPMSRDMAAVYARQEMAAYAFIRAWMADDVDKGMLLIEQQNIPKESVIFVLSLVKTARRAPVGDRVPRR